MSFPLAYDSTEAQKRMTFSSIAIGLLLFLGAAAAEAACGCSNLTVRWTGGTSGTYCSPDVLPNGCQWIGDRGTNGCAPQQRPYNCPLGPIEPAGNAAGNFGWGFEIVAALTPGSNASECPEGQANSATITKDGSVQQNTFIFDDEPPAGDYDFAGGLQVRIVSDVVVPQYNTQSDGRLVLGADDYTEPSLVKVHDGQVVRWVDTPLVSVSANEQWTEQSQFLSFIKPSEGGDPSCWCLFTIDHGWNAGVQTRATVTLNQSHNCTLDPAQ